MKKTAVNILSTTGITLLILSLFALAFGGTCLFLRTVFEAFGANTVIHLGFLLTHKFECKYAVLEATLDIGYTIAVVAVFGKIFDWYASTPIWVLLLMAVLVYLAGVLLSMFRMRQDIQVVNELLHKRNQQKQTKKECER